MKSVALRPMLAQDVPALAKLFRESVEQLAEEDYSDAQRAAWAAAADDEAAFAARLAKALTLIAAIDGEIAGFASLQGGTIDMLYVHPNFVRQKAAATLIDALEKLAFARGVKTLDVDASDNAKDFFAARGFIAWRRNTIVLNDEWLGNTSMKKQLETKPAGAKLQ